VARQRPVSLKGAADMSAFLQWAMPGSLAFKLPRYLDEVASHLGNRVQF
jgi:hypothetical protein